MSELGAADIQSLNESLLILLKRLALVRKMILTTAADCLAKCIATDFHGILNEVTITYVNVSFAHFGKNVTRLVG